jgi:acylphosphatase
MKIKMRISGSKVHGVGYRPWLFDAAIDNGLEGFYSNAEKLKRMEKDIRLIKSKIGIKQY